MVIRLETISTGRVKPLWVRDSNELRSVMSGIDKKPVSTASQPTAIEVSASGICGDEQADHLAHGGIEKALYVYPQEHYSHWTALLSLHRIRPIHLEHGYFGENLTISGLLEDQVYIGDRFLMGCIECAVTKLREPCYKFTAKTGFPRAAKEMLQTTKSGWYLRVMQAGFIQAGDEITVIAGPRHTSIAAQNRALLQSLR